MEPVVAVYQHQGVQRCHILFKFVYGTDTPEVTFFSIDMDIIHFIKPITFINSEKNK